MSMERYFARGEDMKRHQILENLVEKLITARGAQDALL